jgi:cell division protease FtsH
VGDKIVDQEPGNNKENKNMFGRQGGSGCWIGIMWLVLLIALAPLAARWFGAGPGAQANITYTEFREQVVQGNVESITVQADRIVGELAQPQTLEGPAGEEVSYTTFETFLPTFGDEGLFALLQDNNVIIDTQPQETFAWGTLLISMLPFVILIGLIYYFMRNARGQGQDVFAMGKSRAKLFQRSSESTMFSDVAGNEGTKRELEEVVEFLKEPSKFKRLGGKIPKGVLLVGPPGTGKTLLARAVAGEANVPFFSITGSDFMEMFVGVGASRVRNLFKDAKKSAPSIIFIDELDSIGRRRGAGVGGGHDEREQTLNQLLSELDGFEANENVIVMAATNRPDILDPALLRPGRFDRQVTVDLPTLKDRLMILKIHSRNKPLDEDVQLEKIARGTPGFSGADLENILNEAALLAARRNKNKISNQDIDDSRDKVLMGLERENLTMTEREAKVLAYHEAGHAVVAAVLPQTDPVHKVTIVPRGRAMGVTQQLPERDRYLYPREYMLDRLAVMMGGRAAEELVMNSITSGAENDLKESTRLVRKMVMDWGMSDALGHIALDTGNGEVFLGEEMTQRREFSERTAFMIDEEVKKILHDAFDRAKQTLEEHRDGLDRLVEALLEKEEVFGDEVLKIVGVERPEKEKELAEI